MSALSVVNLNSRRPKGRCRAYRQRTVDYVERSVASWQVIFGRKVSPLQGDYRSCAELAGLIKGFLSRDVSDVPREQLSFQSIKKGLPDSCACMEDGMLDKLVSSIGGPPKALPEGYLDFVRKEILTLFRKGWDTKYEQYCLTTSPPLSACSEEIRSHGGSLAAFHHEKTLTEAGFLAPVRGQSWFLDATLFGREVLPEKMMGSLMVVQSSGKPRPLSKFQSEMLLLKPLHKVVYGHLKQFPWLLVGPPTASKLRRAGFKEGEGVLVSGDYKSATDGLSIEVAETIMSTLFQTSACIPTNIQGFALRALRPTLSQVVKDPSAEFGLRYSEVDVTVGQMMGSLLSFPLLCLQNYLAFRWSMRGVGLKKKVPLLINGDDILFQKDNHYLRWTKVLGPVGLTVEESKTSVERDWGTINSTLLVWEQGFLVPSWSPRFGMFRPAEHPASLGRSFADFLCGCEEPDIRFRAGREWFRWHLGELRDAALSLPSLGFRGLLARRLGQVFGLLNFPSGELPRAYRKHEVGFGDFVSRIDLSALSPEELLQSSIEVAARKWADGFKGTQQVREAILYCLSRSAVKWHRHDYPSDLSPFYATDDELRFRLRNTRLEWVRRTPSKAFLAPFPPREDVLFMTSVMYNLSWGDDELGILPPYTEFPDGIVGGG